MKRTRFILLAILILIATIGIVSAVDYPFIVTKTHDVTPVNPGDLFTYTIAFTNPYDFSFFEPSVRDTIPNELEIVSCSGCCNMEAAPNVEWEGICQMEITPGETLYRTITVKLKPDTAGKTFCNQATVGGGLGEDHQSSGYTSAEDCITVPEKPVTAPEFPSIFLPATMIIGFLGTVLLIQRTKEH